jgi:PRTRC genetic system protein A
MIRVGYLLHTEKGLEGEPGFFYNYILAGNGIFICAQGPLLAATVQVAEAEIRGLARLEESLQLPHGKIPGYIRDLAIAIFALEPRQERYAAVVWDRGYDLRVPPQNQHVVTVQYDWLPHTLLDIHSHGTMHAWFSGTDNRDEQGLRLYMVAGKMDELFPEVLIRVGVYGYFAPLLLEDVFDV